MKTEIFLAFRYLFRGKARHVSFIGIISCLGITLGVATLIVVISVMNGFDKDLMEKLMRFNYHLTIEGMTSDDYAVLAERINHTPGVKSSTLYIQTQVFGQFDGYIVPLVVRGVDFTNEIETRAFRRYLVEETSKEGFFIGDKLRERFYFGQELSYYPLDKKPRLQKKPVRGVFKIGLYDVDSNYIVCDVSSARALGDHYLPLVGIRINDPFEAGAVKKRLSWLGGEGFLIYTWSEANQVLFSALQLEKLTMFIILSLIIVVASFNIFATLTVKVVEKTKDIGILKALGFNAGRILSVFTLQGLILGFIGVTSGTGLGLVLCAALKRYHFIAIPQEIYYIDYLPVLCTFKDIFLIVSVGMVLSFISSLFPAMRASRLPPCEALRYE